MLPSTILVHTSRSIRDADGEERGMSICEEDDTSSADTVRRRMGSALCPATYRRKQACVLEPRRGEWNRCWLALRALSLKFERCDTHQARPGLLLSSFACLSFLDRRRLALGCGITKRVGQHSSDGADAAVSQLKSAHSSSSRWHSAPCSGHVPSLVTWPPCSA